VTTGLAVGEQQPAPPRRPGGRFTQRAPLLVPGTVVACFCIATGRWGSHLGWWQHSIYLTDIALVLTAVWAVLRHRRHVRWDRSRLLLLALPAVAIPVWAGLRLLTASGIDSMALRDLAPFVYVSVALLGMIAVDESARRRTTVLLGAALVLHAVWVTAALHVTLPTYYLSGGLLRVFELRPDFDSAMLAVLCALAVYETARADRLWRRATAALVACWPAYVLFETNSRAGALALVAALAVTAVALLRGIHVTRRQLLVGGVVLVAALAVLVPQTSLWSRMTGDAEFGLNSAQGTTAAREQAWRLVFDYVSESPSRALVGVGPGPDFLVASGARPYFGQVHQNDIRVPHNVLLNYYARLGLVGLGLFLALVVSLVRAAWHLVITTRPRTVDLAQVLITATLLLASLVGVILESPFGAVPFFWALGQLVSTWLSDRGSEPTA
jgi:O-antigen ligase